MTGARIAEGLRGLGWTDGAPGRIRARRDTAWRRLPVEPMTTDSGAYRNRRAGS